MKLKILEDTTLTWPSLSTEHTIFLYRKLVSLSMKIKCPDCPGPAELSDDFGSVKCSKCSLDMTYGEYVRYIGYKDAKYRNILNDYRP